MFTQDLWSFTFKTSNLKKSQQGKCIKNSALQRSRAILGCLNLIFIIYLKAKHQYIFMDSFFASKHNHL